MTWRHLSSAFNQVLLSPLTAVDKTSRRYKRTRRPSASRVLITGDLYVCLPARYENHGHAVVRSCMCIRVWSVYQCIHACVLDMCIMCQCSIYYTYVGVTNDCSPLYFMQSRFAWTLNVSESAEEFWFSLPVRVFFRGVLVIS